MLLTVKLNVQSNYMFIDLTGIVSQFACIETFKYLLQCVKVLEKLHMYCYFLINWKWSSSSFFGYNSYKTYVYFVIGKRISPSKYRWNSVHKSSYTFVAGN